MADHDREAEQRQLLAEADAVEREYRALDMHPADDESTGDPQKLRRRLIELAAERKRLRDRRGRR